MLVGPAGTGKTALLNTLVARPEIAQTASFSWCRPARREFSYQPRLSTRHTRLRASSSRRAGTTPTQDATSPSTIRSLDALDWLSSVIIANFRRSVLVAPVVDIVEWLKPAAFTEATRVAPGYVELTVPTPEG